MNRLLKITALARPWQKDRIYRDYVLAQVTKSSNAQGQPPPPRLVHLVQRLVGVQSSVRGKTVLCVGCRSGHELDLLRIAGYTPVGIDLMGNDDQVLAMDMHALTFPSKVFDAVFACHSLEHAYDVTQVLTEWARVTKPGGLWAVEVPIRFEPTSVDRHDFGSLEGLRTVLKPYLAEELWAETRDEDRGVARMIGRVR